jgi:uncharacterized protein
MAALRHAPQRTCVGCRRERAKRDLVRIVRAPDAQVRVDTTGKAAGRGAYICRDPACWTAALRRGSLAGALRVNLAPADREALERFRDSLAPAPAIAGEAV